MDLVCAILFASFCVGGGDGTTKLTIDEGGIFGNSYMEAKGWRAQVELHTDNLRRLIPAKLTSACSDAGCVGYIKSCQDRAATVICTWYFSSGSRWISLEADDSKSLAAAEDRISFVPNGSGSARPIKLSAMSKLTGGDPYCHSAGAEPGEVELKIDAYSGGTALGPIVPPMDLSRYYPDRLSRMRKDGEAHLHCGQTATHLTDCAVTSEAPPDFALGQSATQIAKLLRAPFPETQKGVDLTITYRRTPAGISNACPG